VQTSSPQNRPGAPAPSSKGPNLSAAGAACCHITNIRHIHNGWRKPSFQERIWAVAASISFMVMFSLPLRIAMTAAVETT
jgi:hypothetical protein